MPPAAPAAAAAMSDFVLVEVMNGGEKLSKYTHHHGFRKPHTIPIQNYLVQV